VSVVAYLSSTLILRPSFLLGSAKTEWWYFFRHVSIRSKRSNSMKQVPMNFSVPLYVRRRISVGLIFSKCSAIDSLVAV
jgi:hypothetical protein